MREKRNYVVITFHTTTEAMAYEKRCGEEGIPGRIIPVPRELSASCGLSWRMTAEEYSAYAPQVAALGLAFDQMAEVRL